jgi:hypothetical protein
LFGVARRTCSLDFAVARWQGCGNGLHRIRFAYGSRTHSEKNSLQPHKQ